MKKIIIATLFVLSIGTAKAQVGFSYLHSDVISTFGISSNPDKFFWAEARLSLDVDWSNVGPEFVGFFNVVRREDFDFFLGTGARFNALEGIILPAFGFKIKPIESKPDLTLHAEGMFVVGENSEVFKGSIGIRYFLRRKKN